ncbi:hypothetical protein [Streptomyces sp. Ag109_O5-10]|uniref:hypothetical protein n=1 Tax=Streptomyces sp. Ag109_O5-10 TaxID=1855349 RepID=UPI000895F1D6|nr:hypothetical protein [Streptomyces sp. Ag109_O5-10]SED71071.1 hypothetical protein SAMN05216533_0348 [Streptomyces sp. Ag109_O5-10]
MIVDALGRLDYPTTWAARAATTQLFFSLRTLVGVKRGSPLFLAVHRRILAPLASGEDVEDDVDRGAVRQRTVPVLAQRTIR